MLPFDDLCRIEAKVLVITGPDELDSLGQPIDYLDGNGHAGQAEQIADFGQPYGLNEAPYLLGLHTGGAPGLFAYPSLFRGA